MSLRTARTVVVVSRQWHAPEITVHVDGAGIAIAQDLADFVRALAAEVGSPFGILTGAQLEAKLAAASLRVVEGMKAETGRVV